MHAERPAGHSADTGRTPGSRTPGSRALAGAGPLPALWTRTAHGWVRERIALDEQRLAAQRAIQDVADGCLACRPVLRASR